MTELKSKVLHAAVATLLFFLPLAAFLHPVDLYVLMGAVSVVTSLAAVHAYWPALRFSVSRSISDLDKTDVLSMSIILVFLSIAARETYVTFHMTVLPLTIGRPDEYFVPLSFFRYAAITAAVMALTARDDIIGPRYLRRVPGWPRAILSLFAGVMVGIIVLKYLR